MYEYRCKNRMTQTRKTNMNKNKASKQTHIISNIHNHIIRQYKDKNILPLRNRLFLRTRQNVFLLDVIFFCAVPFFFEDLSYTVNLIHGI